MKRVVVLLTVCTAFWTSTCPAEEKEEAAKVFQEAVRLYNAEQFSEAAEKFRRANELKPNWKLLYNIAQAEASAKRTGIALQTFEEYLTCGGDDITAERRSEVVEEIKRLRELVGAIDVEAPDGAVVMVDGMERGVTPLPGSVLVSAGVNHLVTVVYQGEELLSRTIRLSGRESKTLMARAPQAREEKTASRAPRTETVEKPGDPTGTTAPVAGKSGLKPAGFALIGVGGALLLSGVITGGVAMSRQKELEDACDGLDCYGVDGDIQKSRDSLALATDILLPVGAIAAATGVVLLIVAGRKGGEKAARLTPTPGGLGLEGRF